MPKRIRTTPSVDRMRVEPSEAPSPRQRPIDDVETQRAFALGQLSNFGRVQLYRTSPADRGLLEPMIKADGLWTNELAAIGRGETPTA